MRIIILARRQSMTAKGLEKLLLQDGWFTVGQVGRT